MNNLSIIGNNVIDPELKYFQSGTASLSGCVAVKRQYAKDGYQDTDFLNYKAIGKNAENIAKYFKKGMKIAITGSYQKDQYEKDGQKKTYDYIMVSGWEFVESKKQDNDMSMGGIDTSDFQAVEDDFSDDIPF